MDNKTLRTSHKSQQYVITVKKDGVLKYIDRSFSKHMNCTVLLNRARRFQSKKQAMSHAKYLGIEDRCNIASVQVEIKLIQEKGDKRND